MQSNGSSEVVQMIGSEITTPRQKPQRSRIIMSESRILFLALRCGDLERSRAFYAALGFDFQPEQHGGGPVHYATRIGEMVLELYPSNEKAHPTHFARMGIALPSLDYVFDLVKDNGGVVVHHDDRRMLVRDPDGNSVELLTVTDS